MNVPKEYIRFIFQRFEFMRECMFYHKLRCESYLEICDLRNAHTAKNEINFILKLNKVLQNEETNVRKILVNYPYIDDYDIELEDLISFIEFIDGEWKRFIKKTGYGTIT